MVLGTALVLSLLGFGQLVAVAVTDSLSDGNDTANPTWTHVNGAVGSTEQVWDASSGKYRLFAPSNSQHPELFGYGFVGSYVEPLYTDVRVTADFLDFPIGITGGYFAVAARLNGNNGGFFTGTGIALQGYSYQYEAAAAGGDGEIVLNILHGVGFKDIGSQLVTLDPLKDYRFVLEITGNVLHGQVLELDAAGGVVGIVGEKTRDLDAEPVGDINHDGDPATPDQPFVPFTSGYSGTYGVGHIFYSDIDYTIDNFSTESLAPSPADFDGDGDVDGVDLTIWSDEFGPSGAADADVDDDSDGADFLIWQQQRTGSLATAAGGAIPEPAAAALMPPMLIAAINGRRRRR